MDHLEERIELGHGVQKMLNFLHQNRTAKEL